MVSFTRFIFSLSVFVVFGACGMDDNNKGDKEEETPTPQKQSSQLAYYYGHYQIEPNPSIFNDKSEEFVIRVDVEDKQPKSMHLKQLSPTGAVEKITLQCQQLLSYRCAGKDSRNYEFKFEFFAWNNAFELHNFWVSLADSEHAWVRKHTAALTTAKIRETHFSDTEASKSVTQMQEGDLFTKWSASLCPHLQKLPTKDTMLHSLRQSVISWSTSISYGYGLKNDSCSDRKFVFKARDKFIRFALTHGIGCALAGNDFKLEFKASDNSHSLGCEINSVSIIDGDGYSKGEGDMGITASQFDENTREHTNEKYLWVEKNGKWDGNALDERDELENRIGMAIPTTICLQACTPTW